MTAISSKQLSAMPCWLNSLEALRIMRALVSAASSLDFRIAVQLPVNMNLTRRSRVCPDMAVFQPQQR